MKSWRTLIAVTAILFMAGGAFAGGKCFEKTDLTLVWPVTQCPDYHDATNTAVGNQFPWESSTFFFSSFRNQYLYPSTTVTDMRSTACTIETIGARTVSFAGAGTNAYGSFPTSIGGDSTITVSDAVSDSLVSTFALNSGSTINSTLVGDDTDPIVFSSRSGPNGATISSCDSCPGADALERDAWIETIDLEAGAPGNGNLLVDHNLAVGVGNAGAGVWDVTSSAFGQGCSEPQRAFGSGSFANPAHLTTALGVDQATFIWVFQGLAPPPAATVEQQIAEIIRLLLTPEGLRCSSLDLSPDGVGADDPIAFPDGAGVDTMSPQVSSGGEISGDEAIDALRQCGWNCP